MPASQSHSAASRGDILDASRGDILDACDSTSAHRVLHHIEEMLDSFTPSSQKVQSFPVWLAHTYQCDMQGLARHVAAEVANALKVMSSIFANTLESECKGSDTPQAWKMWTKLVNETKLANEAEGNVTQCFTPQPRDKKVSTYKTITDVCQRRDCVYIARQKGHAEHITLNQRRLCAVLQLEIPEVTVKLIDMVLLAMLKVYYMQKYFEQRTCLKCEDILHTVIFSTEDTQTDQKLQLDLIIFACFKLYLALESTELTDWVNEYESKINNHSRSITNLLRKPKHGQMQGNLVKKLEIPPNILVQEIFAWNGREFWLLPHQYIGPDFKILPHIASRKDFFVGKAGMMNKCITGKNVYDTVNALLIISPYKEIDKQLWNQSLQNLPDIMAVYSLRFSACAIAVTVVMTVLNEEYCRLKHQIRQSDIKKQWDLDNTERENDCENLAIYYDSLMKQRATYYDSLEGLQAALAPSKRKFTSSPNVLDLTVENIQKIVNGTISTPEVGDI